MALPCLHVQVTYFPAPFEITDADTTTDSSGDEIPTPDVYQVDVRVDAFQIPRVFDGEPSFRERAGPMFNEERFPDHEPGFALLGAMPIT